MPNKMDTEFATRLYNSAERAIVEQFPHLPIDQKIELIIDELEHRYGTEMAFDIVFCAL